VVQKQQELQSQKSIEMEKLTLRWGKMLKTNVLWAICGDKSINKVHMKGCPFNFFFIIHVRVKKINPTKNDQDWDV
jgi:hypothetical protein